MGEAARAAVQEWRSADDEAKAAEDRVRAAWAAYHSRQGRAPSGALIAEVSRLRKIADDKLAIAISLSHPESKPPRLPGDPPDSQR